MPSIKDIAQAAGLSVATVSRALNKPELVAPETRRLVSRVANELGYQPNRVAQSLRTRRSKIVGLVVPDIINPVYTELVGTVQDALDKSGYSLVLCESRENAGRETNYLNLLHSWNAAGVIIAPVREPDISSAAWRAMSDRMVQLSRYIPGLSTDAVVSDNEQGAWNITSHLIWHGHRRIGLVSGPSCVNSAGGRIRGYLRALKEAGIEPSDDLIVEGPFSEEVGYNLTRALMSRPNPPEAIVSGSNLLTIGVLRALKDMGKTIPGDVALVAFDDIPTSTVLPAPLTVAAQKTEELGAIAVEILLRRIGNRKRNLRPRIVEIPTEFIIRESCGCKRDLKDSHKTCT